MKLQRRGQREDENNEGEQGDSFINHFPANSARMERKLLICAGRVGRSLYYKGQKMCNKFDCDSLAARGLALIMAFRVIQSRSSPKQNPRSAAFAINPSAPGVVFALVPLRKEGAATQAQTSPGVANGVLQEV